jgi:hypothetical protein
MLKVPDENLTLIILANTDNLSRPYRLGDGDVLNSPVALAFYELFVFESQSGQAVPETDWAAEADPWGLIQETADEQVRGLLALEYVSYKMLVGKQDSLAEVEKRIEARLNPDVDPQVYDAYVGRYGTSAAEAPPLVAVTSENGRLYLVVPDGPKLALFPESETRFFHISVDGPGDFELRFVLDETGQAIQGLVKAEGQEFRYDRIAE